jgi:hypothetical protein
LRASQRSLELHGVAVELEQPGEVVADGRKR